MQLSPNGSKWLKIIHLFCAACWIGGALSLVLLHFPRLIGLGDGSELHGIDRAAHVIDMGIVVTLGAFGCLLSGFVYSAFTRWGFIKHKWIIAKWFITIACIAFGTLFLGPWEVTMGEISATLGQNAHSDGAYNLARWCNAIFGFAQGCVLCFVVWVSVMKPWGKKATAASNTTSQEAGENK